jgi:hypothetical protein
VKRSDGLSGLGCALLLTALQATAMVAAGAAQAQTTACDMLKSTLAARIEATGVRDYELEAVPASDPTPPDARVIGNCSTGAYKVLYRRGVGVQGGGVQKPAPEAARAARPAAEPPPVTAPDLRSRGRRGPAADPAPQAAAAPPAASRPLPPPVAGPSEAASAAPLPVQPQTQALHGPPVPEHMAGLQLLGPPPERPQALSGRALGAAAAPASAAPGSALRANAAQAPPSPRWAFVLTVSRWGGALLLLLLAGAAAAWLVHRSAYDAAGLPRGPKVRSL